jgi:hypothetical protein
VSAPDDTGLLHIAGSISDGAGVDWDRLKAQAADADADRVLRELQALEQIAAFHRKAPPSDTATADHPVSSRTPALRTWKHFTLLETIGVGSFGAVYRARDTKLQKDVALKLVPLPGVRTLYRSRALKEARMLARVDHDNIVKVYGTDIAEGHAGIWMEFIEGDTLSARLREDGVFGAREAALIGCDLCRALAAVHRAGLVHGDVKPRNVMREAGGRIVLMDFGTGKDLRLQPVPTGAGDIAGTPLYLAPEVFDGAPRSRLTDIYSVGVLLYHLVTNGYPFDGTTQADVEEAHRTGARTRLRDLRPDLPEEFVAAVEQATAVNPEERFQSAGTLEAVLARFVGRAPAALPPAPRGRWTAAAAVIVLAAIGAASYWGLRPQKTSMPVAASAAPPAATGAAGSSYRIDAAFYRQRGEAQTRLRSGDRVAPGDQLFANLRVSIPTYVYIVNEDERGESFVLFPMSGRSIDNPVAPGAPVRVPGRRDDDVSWQITSAGGREHFLIFASPERLQAFEDIFAALPRPVFGRAIENPKLPPSAVGRLRGVGGLAAPQGSAPSAHLAPVFTTPLGDREETAHGLWVRQLTVENPRR